LGSNGISEGEYEDLRPAGISLIHATLHLRFGGDMQAGQGAYLCTLPVSCASPPATPIGYGFAYQPVGGQTEGNVQLIEFVVARADVMTMFLTGLGDLHHIRHDHPWPMKPNDFIRGSITYKPSGDAV
jgi:hypothetical protein